MSPRVSAALLLALGSLGMLGHIVGSKTLRGLGAMTCASPAPKVFSAVRGLETYSTRFRLAWLDTKGATQGLKLTPAVYSRLEGPYNRRNVYGAALAFGPVLATDAATQAMHASVMRYAACGERPLLAELGIDPATVASDVRVELTPLPGSDIGDLPRTLAVACP